MMTPPLSMRASPALTAKLSSPSPLVLLLWPLPFVGSSVAIVCIVSMVYVCKKKRVCQVEESLRVYDKIKWVKVKYTTLRKI
jgi:hypothetical protein